MLSSRHDVDSVTLIVNDVDSVTLIVKNLKALLLNVFNFNKSGRDCCDLIQYRLLQVNYLHVGLLGSPSLSLCWWLFK
uniref:Uncharacterized protein n=1 Tax=Ciona intestinalis TaxID=7719 RepID=H2XX09_CIOIN